MPSIMKSGFVPALALTAALSLAESGTFPSFVDVAARAGVLLMNICGGSVKNYIVEANGNGAAFFDYDRDGDADLLVTNGSTLAKYKTRSAPCTGMTAGILSKLPRTRV